MRQRGFQFTIPGDGPSKQKQVVASHPQARAENNEVRMFSFLLGCAQLGCSTEIQFKTDFCLGNGDAYSGLGLPHELSKSVPYRHVHS